MFPVLGSVESPADYCCKDIFFEPRSAVENVPSLNYRRAWVELELMPNRYYNLSAPLKQTYTGDMFVPDSTKAKAAYFEPLTEGNWAENRFNPSVYQRLWATTAHGKLAPPDNKGELVDQTLGIMQTRWSRHFNAVAKAYGEGEGFSLWVDNGELPATDALRIRLPKTHDTYHYYNDYDHAILGEEKVVKDDSICRFIYEAENEKNLVQEYSYKQGGAEVKESRTVFVGQEDYYITLKADTLTNAFLMGNPFMSHLDIRKFLEVNDNVKSVVMEIGDDLQQQTVLRAGGEVVATGGVTTVEPMQSFYVMLKGEPQKEVTLLLTKEMIGGKRAEKPGTTDTPDSSNGGATKEETAPEGLKVTVESLNSGKKSVALFLGACPTQASQYSPNSKSQTFAPTLLDGEIRPEVKVFGVGSDEAYGASRGEAFDIMPLADRIPLGILLDRADSISIVVSSTTGADLSNYVLRDNLTGKDYALGSQVVVANAESSLGRFVLRRIANMPAVADDSFSGVSIMQQGSNVVVQSADANLRSVKVLDMSGRLISKSQGSHARRLQTTGAQGIHIVCIELENGKSRGYKIML